MATVERAIPAGGTALNFTVVGGTVRPTSPKENTIWVNTGLAISNWGFDPATPNYLGLGGVWIKTTVSGDIAFNALKKNTVKLVLNAVYQWNGSALVQKEALVYMGGAWVAFEKIVYSYGSWGSYGNFNLAWSNYGTNSQKANSDNYQFIGSGSANANYRLSTNVDFSNVSKVQMVYKLTGGNSNCHLGVAPAGTGAFNNTEVAKTTFTSDNTLRTVTVDTSSLSGVYNIVIKLDCGSAFTLTMYKLSFM